MREIVSLFASIDTNKDGQLTHAELKRAFKRSSVKIDDEELNTIIKFLDLKNKGVIDFHAFMIAAKEELRYQKALEDHRNRHFTKESLENFDR